MFQLDLQSKLSIYEQIVDNYKRLMFAKVIKQGDKMASVRELSKMLGINPNTVQKAYKELEKQGFIRTESGLGTFACIPESISMESNYIKEIEKEISLKIEELFFLGLDKEKIHLLIEKIIKEREGANDKD